VGAVFVLQLAFTYTPLLQHFFGSTPLPLDTGLAIVAVGAAVLGVLELEKLLLRRFGWLPA
jgi:hypothetical protein